MRHTHVFRHHEHCLRFGFGTRAELVRQQQQRADDQPVHQQFSSAPTHSAHIVYHLQNKFRNTINLVMKKKKKRTPQRNDKTRKQRDVSLPLQ